MALTPAVFTDALLREAQETHPWLHHPLFHMIWDGKLERRQLQSVIRQQGCFFLDTLCGGNIATESLNPNHVKRMAEAMERHYGVPRAALDFYYVHGEIEGDHADRAVRILSRLATTDEEQARGRLAMRRAVAARRICADGMLEAFVGPIR